MAIPNERFKLLLEHLGLTNLALAKALDMDPSVISRYLSGKRRLPAASSQLNAIADYVLSRGKRIQDIEWMQARFAEAGLPTDASTVYRFKQNLIMWLATDGDTLRKNLGRSLPGDIAGALPPAALPPAPREEAAQGEVRVGCLQIVLALKDALAALEDGATVEIFLSSDRIATAADGDFSALLMRMAAQKRLQCNMLLCVSGDTRAMHKLVDAYMAGIVSGWVRLFVVHGLTQAITGTMHILLPGGPCILVNETLGGSAPPVAVTVREEAFVREARDNFAAFSRYAQPVLRVYDDACTREVIELLALEYCTPGGLDVIKDSVNPMFMSRAAYDRFLRSRGHSPQEFAWRSAEFARFKEGMDANLRAGVPFREIISLSRLNDTALRGHCRMAGLYFAERGYIDLDRQGCLDILGGYIDYLTRQPNFSLLILDDLPELHGNNCWHIKRDGHISVNNWQGREPVMVCSDQLMLLREFQARYEAMWARGAGAVGGRASVIGILKDVAGRLEKGN